MTAAVLPLLTNALLLGLRHGLDVDHLCAITDIVGASACSGTAPDDGALPKPLRLSAFYAFGHAAVVTALGLAAILIGVSLPAAVDSLMERLVGVTLVLLGGWLGYRALLKGERRSRGAMLLKLFTGQDQSTYGKRTAFSVGMVHGIGAETGTQILLLATIAGTTERSLAVGLLVAFIGGLLVSNAAVALLSSAGFTASARFDRIKTAIAAGAAVCSVFVGFSMLR